MDRNLYESRVRNLHSWVGHLEPLIAGATAQAMAELGPPGEVPVADARQAANSLSAVARGIHEVMIAHDLLLDAVGRPRRFEEILQGLMSAPTTAESAEPEAAEDLEINRAGFNWLVAELHFDTGWLAGAIHAAMLGLDEEHLDAHLDGIATGIEELLISYDRLQDVLGVAPARHCAYIDRMVVLVEEPRRRRRHDPNV